MKHHVSDVRKRERTLKRGGGHSLFSIDEAQAEVRYGFEPIDDDSPERLFERRWALTVLERAMERLDAEQSAKGRADVFEALRAHLSGEAEDGYATTAANLELSTGAVKVAVHRLRARYRELLRDEVGHTLQDGLDPDQELRELVAALG